MDRQSDLTTEAPAAGLLGATALTLIHQAARLVRDEPPQMETSRRRALSWGFDAAGIPPQAFQILSARRTPVS